MGEYGDSLSDDLRSLIAQRDECIAQLEKENAAIRRNSLEAQENLHERLEAAESNQEAAQRERDALEAENRDLRRENTCDACAGTCPLTCMCKGTGKMSEAATWLREQFVHYRDAFCKETKVVSDLRAKLEAAEREFRGASASNQHHRELLQTANAEIAKLRGNVNMLAMYVERGCQPHRSVQMDEPAQQQPEEG